MVSLRRRPPRTAFVLSGGGNLGAIQVGMLKALAEHDVVPELVLGCSVGALNGAAYARAPTRAGVARMERRWAAVDSPTLMPSSRIPSALQLVRKGESLHDNSGLRRTIDDMLEDQQDFEDLSIEFQCVATEMDSAMAHWFTSGPLAPAILASTALPAVYPPVTVDGVRYVDGGVVDNVPIDRAVELGCTRIFVIHLGPHGRPDAHIRRPIDGALLAYWLARNSRFARDLAALPEGVEAIVLPSGERPELRYDDFGSTPELIEQGYANTSAFLESRAAEIEAQRSGPSLRTALARLRLPAGRGRTQAAERAATDPHGAIVVGDEEVEAGSAEGGGPGGGAEDGPDDGGAQGGRPGRGAGTGGGRRR